MSICYWLYDEEMVVYMTGCGETFEFTHGDITQNGFNYCPYCGCLIEEKE